MTTISKFALATAILLAFSPAFGMAKGTDGSHDGRGSHSERGDSGRDSRDKADSSKDDSTHDKGDAGKDDRSRDKSGDGNRDAGDK